MRAGSTNGRLPEAHYWRCRMCGYERLQMADVQDAVGLCHAIVNEHVRRGALLEPDDREDLHAHLMGEVTDAWQKWDRARGMTFTSYATGRLRFGIHNWYRLWRGREARGEYKPIADYVPLDPHQDDPLGASFRHWQGAGRDDRSSAGDGLLAQGDRRALRKARELGVLPGADAA